MTLSPPVVQTLVLFVLMAIGFGAGKARILDEAGSKGTPAPSTSSCPPW